MTEFSREELHRLLTLTNGPFVTITMPVVVTGVDQHENTTRFKNVLREYGIPAVGFVRI